MVPEVWVGLIEVVPGADHLAWHEAFGSAQGGFTWALAMAEDETAFRETVSRLVADEGFAVQDWDDVATFSEMFENEEPSVELEEARQKLLSTSEPQLTTFHVFPPPDFRADESWVDQLDEAKFTPFQLEIARRLQEMSQEVDLPNLSGVSAVEDGDIVEFIFHHAEEDGFDLSIDVAQASVTVDYSIGHIHFDEDDGDGWLDWAYAFVSSALKGGAKIELWEEEGEPMVERVLLLDVNEEWFEYTSAIYLKSSEANALLPELPSPSEWVERAERPPDYTFLLSYKSPGDTDMGKPSASDARH